jgi:hypothetical protein
MSAPPYGAEPIARSVCAPSSSSFMPIRITVHPRPETIQRGPRRPLYDQLR